MILVWEKDYKDTKKALKQTYTGKLCEGNFASETFKNTELKNAKPWRHIRILVLKNYAHPRQTGVVYRDEGSKKNNTSL